MEDKPGVQDAGRNNGRKFEWRQLFTTTLGRGNLVALLLFFGAATASGLGGPIAGNFANIIALSGVTALLLAANFLTFGWCKKFATAKDEETGTQKIHWPSLILFVGITALIWVDLIAVISSSIKSILQTRGG